MKKPYKPCDFDYLSLSTKQRFLAVLDMAPDFIANGFTIDHCKLYESKQYREASRLKKKFDTSITLTSSFNTKIKEASLRKIITLQQGIISKPGRVNTYK